MISFVCARNVESETINYEVNTSVFPGANNKMYKSFDPKCFIVLKYDFKIIPPKGTGLRNPVDNLTLNLSLPKRVIPTYAPVLPWDKRIKHKRGSSHGEGRAVYRSTPLVERGDEA
ncbi:hypothetical protein GDO78_006415 [Eleutherodactylus coqui]|uniref:Uncharacterized protein n=1 Tax=Eleutherodactylus coqui TaxID=57060 RepID=A0A8J6KGT2_ELECQ|nr:hypothetical protein GDO78_006415 [Eleutherodactylus coqui]